MYLLGFFDVACRLLLVYILLRIWFLQATTVLGMILAYLAGRRADKNHQRKEPPPGKDNGSFDE